MDNFLAIFLGACMIRDQIEERKTLGKKNATCGSAGLWKACCLAGKICKNDPPTGKILENLKIPHKLTEHVIRSLNNKVSKNIKAFAGKPRAAAADWAGRKCRISQRAACSAQHDAAPPPPCPLSWSPKEQLPHARDVIGGSLTPMHPPAQPVGWSEQFVNEPTDPIRLLLTSSAPCC